MFKNNNGQNNGFVTPKAGQLLEIRFPVGISAVLFALVCLGGVIFWFYPHLRDELTFFGAAFGMSAGVVAAYYIGKTLEITVSQRNEGLTSDKVNKAFSFIQRWNGAPFQDRQGWRELQERVKGKQPSEIASIIEGEYKERAIVVDVFNFFEEMALAMNEGLADEATLRRFFRDMVERYYTQFGDWVNKMRTDGNRPRPRVYIEFEAVVKRWQQIS